MHWFHDQPIRQKLQLVILVINAAALLLVGCGVIGYELWRFQSTAVADLSAVARLIGENCEAALTFGDSKAAGETLATLSTDPDLISAAIYDRQDRMFVQYQRSGGAPPIQPADMKSDGYRFDRNQLMVWHRIGNTEPLGTVYLRRNMARLWTRVWWSTGIVVMVLVVSLVVAMLLAAWLQRLIADPILHLAGVAREITEKKDYSRRAVPQSGDETGQLIASFNEMLGRIEERDDALRQAYDQLEARSAEVATSERRFRQVTENIREVFWLTNLDKTQMIYISPGYERIWGRPRECLYLDPRSWLQTIHPEDRDRVTRAALTRQATGEYDEEYRIVRPDGTVRWIRDRAFPVTDEGGTVYRLAGIAEDVTEQLQLEQEILGVSDREQRRIGQDLHDGLCQHLVGTSFASAVLAEKLSARGLSAEMNQAREIGRLLNQAITQARSLARGLFPVDLDGGGLSAALQNAAMMAQQLFGVPCTFRGDRAAVLRDHAAATHLYRIAQESLHNAIKHGRPRHVWIRLAAEDDDIVLSVRDDGIGFTEPPKEGRGMGLAIMSYRARMMGAVIDVRRVDGGGTVVTCRVHRPNETTADQEANHAAEKKV